ncbi:MAG: glycosyltransferase [Conexivisphaerales archaeon]
MTSHLRTAILAWEYPPRVMGELAYYVERLAHEVSGREGTVHVISFHEARPATEAVSPKIQLHWTHNPVDPHLNVLTWSLSLCSEAQRVAADIFYSPSGGIDVIDVHDWHFVSAAVGLKKALGLPFVFTVHSLEEQRSREPSSPLSSCVRGLEWLGLFESAVAITASATLKSQVEALHNVPPSKVRVVDPSSPSWVDDTLRAYREARDLQRGA